MAAMPADADPLSGRPANHTGTNRINDAGDFVARHARIPDAGKRTLLRERVAVADTASFNLDSYLSGTRLRNFTFHQFKRSIWVGDLHHTHASHNFSSSMINLLFRPLWPPCRKPSAGPALGAFGRHRVFY
jgi:hypothetical protein